MGIVAPRMLPPGALIGCAVSLLCACTTQVRNMPAASNSGAAPGSSFGCVDDRGNVITAPQIVQASGSQRAVGDFGHLLKSARERGTNAVTASSARAYNVRLLSIVDALHNGVEAKRRNDGFDRI